MRGQAAASVVLRCEGAAQVTSIVSSGTESPAELAIKVLESVAASLWEASAPTAGSAGVASSGSSSGAGVDAIVAEFRPILMELAVRLLGKSSAAPSAGAASAASDAARVLHVVSRAVRAVPHLAPLLLAHGGSVEDGDASAATLRRVINTIVTAEGEPTLLLGWQSLRTMMEDDGGRTMAAPLVRWTPLLQMVRRSVEARSSSGSGGEGDERDASASATDAAALDAVRALSVLFGLDSSDAKAKLMSVLGSASSDAIDRRIEESRREITLEWRRQQSALWSERGSSSSSADADAAESAARLPLTAGLVSVEGVVVPSVGAVLQRPLSRAPFIRTPASRRALRSVMSALASEKPLLIAGAAGSGKSTLVREAADATGATLIELHLDDSVDAKTMLGTYVCTQVPGEFKWQPGVLTRAARKGHWVLIEDIATAPFEVLSALTPLIESRHLELPGRGDTLVPHARFRLLATVTTAGGEGDRAPRPISAAVAGLLQGLWTRVRVGSIDEGALRTIVRARFGSVIPPATREAIVQTYERFARGNGGREEGEAEETLAGEEAEHAATGGAKAKAATGLPPPASSVLRAAPIGPRDLIKWCERVVANAARLGFTPALNGADASAERAFHAVPGQAIWPVLNRGMATEHVTEARRAEIIAAGVDVLVAS